MHTDDPRRCEILSDGTAFYRRYSAVEKVYDSLPDVLCSAVHGWTHAINTRSAAVMQWGPAPKRCKSEAKSLVSMQLRILRLNGSRRGVSSGDFRRCICGLYKINKLPCRFPAIKNIETGKTGSRMDHWRYFAEMHDMHAENVFKQPKTETMKLIIRYFRFCRALCLTSRTLSVNVFESG